MERAVLQRVEDRQRMEDPDGLTKAEREAMNNGFMALEEQRTRALLEADRRRRKIARCAIREQARKVELDQTAKMEAEDKRMRVYEKLLKQKQEDDAYFREATQPFEPRYLDELADDNVRLFE